MRHVAHHHFRVCCGAIASERRSRGALKQDFGSRERERKKKEKARKAREEGPRAQPSLQRETPLTSEC